MKKNNPASSAGRCKKYAQAITDYVLGEEIDVPKEELMGHLKECARCRKEATDWQDFQDALRVKEYHSRPEVKEKWDRFIRELTRAPGPGEQSIDIKWELGSAAGKIYRVLEANGKVAIPVIKKETGLKDYHLHQGIGWLAAQGKILMSKDEQTAYVFLAESERP
jgi:hypothetical protein